MANATEPLWDIIQELKDSGRLDPNEDYSQKVVVSRPTTAILPLGIWGVRAAPEVLAEVARNTPEDGNGNPLELPEWCQEKIREKASEPSKAGQGPLLKAVVGGDSKEVARLLKGGNAMELANVCNSGGDSLLILATKCDYLEVATKLLEAKADVNRKGVDSGATSLHECAWLDYPDVAEALIDRGATVEMQISGKARNLFGYTALHIAAKRNSLRAMQALLSAGAADMYATTPRGESPFYVAAFNRSIAAMNTLLAFKADIESRDMNGVTAIHNAVLNSHVDVVQYLLAVNIPVDITTLKDETALYVACADGNCEMANLLVAANCNINLRASNGASPFHAAVSSGHLDLAAFLFSKGATRMCEGKCTKCRLQMKQVERRLNRQKQRRCAEAAEAEQARQKEAERKELEAMEFPDFLAELRAVEAEMELEGLKGAKGTTNNRKDSGKAAGVLGEFVEQGHQDEEGGGRGPRRRRKSKKKR